MSSWFFTKGWLDKLNYESISLSEASAAGVIIGRSAAVVWRPASGQWSVLAGIGKATNQELGGCSCLQAGCRGPAGSASVCWGGLQAAGEIVEDSHPPAPAQDGSVARNCPPARPPLRPHRQDGGGLQAWSRASALLAARSSHP